MSNLILLCGKAGCGKTTLATALKNKYKIIHFSADDFMLKFFGEIEDRKIFDEKLRICKEKIYEISEELLNNNIDVVLDFGFWSRKEREEVKQRFCKFNVIIIYIKLDNETIFNRIQNRNANLKDNEYFMDKNTFEFLSSLFEEPSENEECIIYNNSLEELKIQFNKYDLVKK